VALHDDLEKVVERAPDFHRELML
jgi:hypothetical protein